VQELMKTLLIINWAFLKKITAAGKDPVTTVPAAISILLLIMRKNINTNFIILLSTCAYRMVNNEYNQATKTL